MQQEDSPRAKATQLKLGGKERIGKTRLCDILRVDNDNETALGF